MTFRKRDIRLKGSCRRGTVGTSVMCNECTHPTCLRLRFIRQPFPTSEKREVGVTRYGYPIDIISALFNSYNRLNRVQSTMNTWCWDNNVRQSIVGLVHCWIIIGCNYWCLHYFFISLMVSTLILFKVDRLCERLFKDFWKFTVLQLWTKQL